MDAPLPALSLSLAEFAVGSSPRERILAAGELGYRAVTLDARAAGLRARDLDRSARRDLAATFRRAELRLAGIDLWIPESHFVDTAHQDRAIAVAIGTIDLAAELASLMPADPVVSVVLPTEGATDARKALAAAAETAGVQMADHCWPLCAWNGPIGAGLDPVVALVEKADPVAAASNRSLVTARVCSLGDAALRVPVGSAASRLDLGAYRASLSLAPLLRTVVVDVRGLHDSLAGAEAALEAWSDADLFGRE